MTRSGRVLVQAALVLGMGGYALSNPPPLRAVDNCLACDTNCEDAISQLGSICNGVDCPGGGIVCGETTFWCGGGLAIFAACYDQS